MERSKDECDRTVGIDLDLKLSPPDEHHSPVVPNRSRPKSSEEENFPSKSFDVDVNYKDFNCAAPKVEPSCLVLMGCSRCLLYVMVSKVDPKCPNCRSSILLDMFCENSNAKRPRKS
ncbi:hypothetical protein PanWU01x14_082060 [Parasponia andersonii]|uniref:GIR1-like zinc ribbon domain-containing protein n=1 Tax=Parasponia andersonii TaxID=3476 RepID=A0A2P5DAI0_PARAD|nr:hypothetical protein PanWU01x14_082060 [Parasponia andersonii]